MNNPAKAGEGPNGAIAGWQSPY